jgi:hypothetical protein
LQSALPIHQSHATQSCAVMKRFLSRNLQLNS